MGEKSGGLTNMILVIIALVAITVVINTAFPNITESITAGMQNVVQNTFSSLKIN